MAIPSGYIQLNEGIQFKCNDTTKYASFTAYVDSLTEGNINACSFELTARKAGMPSATSVGAKDPTNSHGKYKVGTAMHTNLQGGSLISSGDSENLQRTIRSELLYSDGGPALDGWGIRIFNGETPVTDIMWATQDPVSLYTYNFTDDLLSETWCYITRSSPYIYLRIKYNPMQYFGINSPEAALSASINGTNDLTLKIYYSYNSSIYDSGKSCTLQYDGDIDYYLVNPNISTPTINYIFTKGSSTIENIFEIDPVGYNFTYNNNNYVSYAVYCMSLGVTEPIGYLIDLKNGNTVTRTYYIIPTIPEYLWSGDISQYPQSFTTQYTWNGYSSVGEQEFYFGMYSSPFRYPDVDYTMYKKFTPSQNFTYKMYFKHNATSKLESSCYVDGIQVYNNTIEENLATNRQSSTIVAGTRPPFSKVRYDSSLGVYIRSGLYNSKSGEIGSALCTDYIQELKIWDANEVLVNDIVPVYSTSTGDLAFYDLVQDDFATVVLGENGEYMNSEDIHVLHSSNHYYIKNGNSLVSLEKAYIKYNNSVVPIGSIDILEVK